MTKSVLMLATVALLAASNVSLAAFNVTVQSLSGPFFPTYSSSSTNTAGGIDIFDSAPFSGTDLIVNYNITNNPGAGNFQINAMNLIYNLNPANISFRVTISEDSATYPVGAGVSVTGFTNLGAFGNTSSTFSSTTTFSGTGANSITFADGPFTASSSPYLGTTNFTSGGSPGLIQISFDVNLIQSGNGNFGNFPGGTGLVGVTDGGVPVPATAFLGLAAVPVISFLRRRRAA
jgi:hypothetical protein